MPHSTCCCKAYWKKRRLLQCVTMGFGKKNQVSPAQISRCPTALQVPGMKMLAVDLWVRTEVLRGLCSQIWSWQWAKLSACPHTSAPNTISGVFPVSRRETEGLLPPFSLARKFQSPLNLFWALTPPKTLQRQTKWEIPDSAPSHLCCNCIHWTECTFLDQTNRNTQTLWHGRVTHSMGFLAVLAAPIARSCWACSPATCSELSLKPGIGFLARSLFPACIICP